jgi:2-succinyl-5-enolpyruvyl-6-hydroxy-3-cyclohexene-1-carboxylate synthase
MKIHFGKIFFCTGARNHDLLHLFNEQNIKFEYDERMASFKALGLAKVNPMPIAICTTSGTAVAECVPAMLEAYYSQIPLILISGDRPKKLHGTGSPQTIDHEALTRSCRRSYLEINLWELEDLELKNIEYPLHINVLVDDTTSHTFETYFHQRMEPFEIFLKKYQRPLFIFSHENSSMRPFIQKFSNLNFPFYAEALSSGRDYSKIKTDKKCVDLFNAGFFDSVIRVGHTPLSKVWRLLEKRPLPVFNFDHRGLPGLSFGEVLPLDSNSLIKNESFWNALGHLVPLPIIDESLQDLNQLIKNFPLSELSLFKNIQDKLEEKDIVYLGNSLVIRFFEMTQSKEMQIFGNRGVNGIDGQLASAIGISMGVSSKVFCILGDVTTFYDLSSMREIPKNLHLIIMNNKGGRIFDMLNLDKRIVLEHEDNFKNISQGLNLSYSSDLHDFGRVQVLELFPDRIQSDLMLKDWNK